MLTTVRLLVHIMGMRNSVEKLGIKCRKKLENLKFLKYERLHMREPQSILPNHSRLVLNSETYLTDLAELEAQIK